MTLRDADTEGTRMKAATLNARECRSIVSRVAVMHARGDFVGLPSRTQDAIHNLQRVAVFLLAERATKRSRQESGALNPLMLYYVARQGFWGAVPSMGAEAAMAYVVETLHVSQNRMCDLLENGRYKNLRHRAARVGAMDDCAHLTALAEAEAHDN